MAKGISYDIQPKIKFLPTGTLLKTREPLLGTNAPGVNESDEEFEFGDQEVHVPSGSLVLFVEDKQFMAASKEKKISAWVRCHIIHDQKVVWITMVCEPKRIWDFETMRGKKRIIKESQEKLFEVRQLGDGR